MNENAGESRNTQERPSGKPREIPISNGQKEPEKKPPEITEEKQGLRYLGFEDSRSGPKQPMMEASIALLRNRCL